MTEKEDWKDGFVPRWRLIETIHLEPLEVTGGDDFKFVIKLYQDRLSDEPVFTSSIHRLEMMWLKIPEYQEEDKKEEDKLVWASYEVMVNDHSYDIGDLIADSQENILEFTMKKLRRE